MPQTTRKNNNPEAMECYAFSDYLRWNHIFFFHIQNENKLLSKLGQAKYAILGDMKKMGVLDGIPDYYIMVHTPKGLKILWLEMKSRTGKLTEAQKERLYELEFKPIVYTAVAYCCDMAIDIVEILIKTGEL